MPEPDNHPCAKCGRTDLPLHTNYQCPECYTPPIDNSDEAVAARRAMFTGFGWTR